LNPDILTSDEENDDGGNADEYGGDSHDDSDSISGNSDNDGSAERRNRKRDAAEKMAGKRGRRSTCGNDVGAVGIREGRARGRRRGRGEGAGKPGSGVMRAGQAP